METKMMTTIFDIELAKKIQNDECPGKIITRDGRNVKIVCFDVKGIYPIIALVEGYAGEEDVESYMISGSRYDDDENASSLDLFLQVPEWTQFKDGDIVACEVHNGPNDYCKWFAVLDGNIGFMLGYAYFSSYVSYDYDSSYKVKQLIYRENYNGVDSIRLITEEEKQMFIKRLQEENTDQAKGILKRFFGIEDSEEKAECEFKPKDWVLCKGYKNWCLCQFSHKEQRYDEEWVYIAVGGFGFTKCIPYNEETKHLLGKSDDWEG